MTEILALPAAQRPPVGTHALVVGVSHYPFVAGADATPEGEQFGLDELSCAARSASEFAAWLITEYHNPAAPISSVRVLLSPTDGELLADEVGNRLHAPCPATRDALEAEFVAFRDECRTSVDNVAIVYLAGHGVQLSKRGALVLLEDFAGPGQISRLHGAVDAVGCHDSFDGDGFPDHQFWFVDACRQRPAIARRFEDMSGGPLRPDEPTGRVGSTPVFLASSTREAAFAQIGASTLFCQALLWSLRGAAARSSGADGSWTVTTSDLLDRLGPRVSELAGEFGEDQHVDVTGRPMPAVIHVLSAPPEADLSVTLTPDRAAEVATAVLRLGGTDPIPVPPGWPLIGRVPAGVYRLDVTGGNGFHDHQHPMVVRPPATNERVELSS